MGKKEEKEEKKDKHKEGDKKKDKKEKKEKKDKKEEKKDKKKEKEVESVIEGVQHIDISEDFVIFFPDEKLPCRRANCTNKNCQFAHEPTNLSRMLDVMKTAKKTLDICVFTVTCDDIADPIIELHNKGIRVRVITDDEQRKSVGSDIEKFVSAGIPVKDDNSRFHMHHKFCIVDNKVLLNGSFNWTRQAVLQNRENVMVTKSAAMVNAFASEFNKMWDMY